MILIIVKGSLQFSYYYKCNKEPKGIVSYMGILLLYRLPTALFGELCLRLEGPLADSRLGVYL